jgi:hypothetical protein
VTALQSPVVRLHSGSGVIHSLDYLGSAGITGLRMTGTALRLPSLSVFFMFHGQMSDTVSFYAETLGHVFDGLPRN